MVGQLDGVLHPSQPRSSADDYCLTTIELRRQLSLTDENLDVMRSLSDQDTPQGPRSVKDIDKTAFLVDANRRRYIVQCRVHVGQL